MTERLGRFGIVAAWGALIWGLAGIVWSSLLMMFYPEAEATAKVIFVGKAATLSVVCGLVHAWPLSSLRQEETDAPVRRGIMTAFVVIYFVPYPFLMALALFGADVTWVFIVWLSPLFSMNPFLSICPVALVAGGLVGHLASGGR